MLLSDPKINSPSLSRSDADYLSFTRDANTNPARRVTDEVNATKLDALIMATGGSVDTTAEIFNVTVVTSGTEVSQALPANTKKFILRSRNRSEVQLSYTSGESGTKYLTIRPGATFEDSNLYVAQTLYFQTSKSAETIEIIVYT